MDDLTQCDVCGEARGPIHNCGALQYRKYDCDACGATVDGRFLQVHLDWHENIELLAETVAAIRIEQVKNAKNTQR